MGQPPSGGSFAIGASDGYHIQLKCRVAKVLSRNQPRCRFETGKTTNAISGSNVHARFVRAERKCFNTGGFNQTGMRTLTQGITHECAAIHRRTWPSDKTIARANFPTVNLQTAGDTTVQPLRSLKRRLKTGD